MNHPSPASVPVSDLGEASSGLADAGVSQETFAALAKEVAVLRSENTRLHNTVAFVLDHFGLSPPEQQRASVPLSMHTVQGFFEVENLRGKIGKKF